jgi:hypothetical protein
LHTADLHRDAIDTKETGFFTDLRLRRILSEKTRFLPKFLPNYGRGGFTNYL